MKHECPRCDDTGLKDYASFGMDPCECRLPAPALPAPVIIGPATLYLGDAYTIRPTLGWMDGDIMDPPYVIKVSGGGAWRAARPGFDQIEDADLHCGFDLSIINPLQCGAVIVFASNDQLADLLRHMKGNFQRHALCVWQKANPQPMANKAYRTDCEFYVHGWSSGFHPAGTVSEKLRVRQFASPRGADRHDHPTCKPLPLMESIMRNISGRKICDPFMGTGTTGIAALRAGKQFWGIERDPRHFETAVNRLEAEWEAMQRKPN